MQHEEEEAATVAEQQQQKQQQKQNANHPSILFPRVLHDCNEHNRSQRNAAPLNRLPQASCNFGTDRARLRHNGNHAVILQLEQQLGLWSPGNPKLGCFPQAHRLLLMLTIFQHWAALVDDVNHAVLLAMITAT